MSLFVWDTGRIFGRILRLMATVHLQVTPHSKSRSLSYKSSSLSRLGSVHTAVFTGCVVGVDAPSSEPWTRVVFTGAGSHHPWTRAALTGHVRIRYGQAHVNRAPVFTGCVAKALSCNALCQNIHLSARAVELGQLFGPAMLTRPDKMSRVHE